MIKRIIVWAIRKAIQWYPDEAFTPPGTHIHKNPIRKISVVINGVRVIYPEGKE